MIPNGPHIIPRYPNAHGPFPTLEFSRRTFFCEGQCALTDSRIELVEGDGAHEPVNDRRCPVDVADRPRFTCLRCGPVRN